MAYNEITSGLSAGDIFNASTATQLNENAEDTRDRVEQNEADIQALQNQGARNGILGFTFSYSTTTGLITVQHKLNVDNIVVTGVASNVTATGATLTLTFDVDLGASVTSSVEQRAPLPQSALLYNESISSTEIVYRYDEAGAWTGGRHFIASVFYDRSELV